MIAVLKVKNDKSFNDTIADVDAGKNVYFWKDGHRYRIIPAPDYSFDYRWEA